MEYSHKEHRTALGTEWMLRKSMRTVITIIIVCQAFAEQRGHTGE